MQPSRSGDPEISSPSRCATSRFSRRVSSLFLFPFAAVVSIQISHVLVCFQIEPVALHCLDSLSMAQAASSESDPKSFPRSRSGGGLARVLASVWVYRTVRLGLGGLFLYAGGSKLLAPHAFSGLISHYHLVPGDLLPVVAVGLPALEVVAGVGAILGRRWSYWALLGLMGLFLFVLWFGILQGLDIDCGCFSPEEQAEHGSLRTAFLRDWLLLVPVGYLLLWGRRNRSDAVPIHRKE